MFSTLLLSSAAFSMDAWLEEPATAPAVNPFAPLQAAVCVPKIMDNPGRLAQAVHWACNYGKMGGCAEIPADCHGEADKQDGVYTFQKYATWVFSKYFHMKSQNGGTCSFDNQAYMTNTPANKECVFPAAIPNPGGINLETPPEYMLELLLSDACGDAADQAVWNGKGKGAFKSDLNACGRQCLGGASCTANCIKKRQGYTAACSSCFGTLTGCTASHCMFDCMSNADGPKCKNCVDADCTPAFKSCSGLTPPAQALEMTTE